VQIHYDVEERDGVATGVARLQLPEKLARTLVAEELPDLDRPLRFVVTRGPRGAVRADSLEEMQALLDRPWTPSETERTGGARRGDRGRGDRGRGGSGDRGGGRPGGGRHPHQGGGGRRGRR
jgi:ATP-dependent helicase HrpA